ncbi:MAG: hypothetical protein H6709_13175 [Kofleriaceae bacterium]|nr:hypothetical protein [Kofleriaceae bacterium]
MAWFDLDGRPLGRHALHAGAVTWTQLERDGGVVTAGVDGAVIRVGPDGALRQRFERAGAATWAAAAPDGSALATGHADGTVRLEPLTTDGALRRACDAIALFGEQARVGAYCAASGSTTSSR